METDMNINRIRILIIFLLISIVCFLLIPLSIHAASRGISVISDLSHQSGKLGAYRALIIGINDYNDPKIPDLETAVNDAQAMANLLRERYGFQVELLLDRKATRKAIYQALRNLASSAKPDDNVLIYYAGHGDLDRISEDGWWIPADAEGGDPVTYLDNFLVQKYIRSMQARHVLLISDSCYSGTLFGQARSMPPVIGDKYYLNLYNEKSRWGMTSGNKTPVSDQGSVGHSVFAYQLLKELRNSEKPYISAQELYTRIAPIISNNSEQTPLCRPIRNTGDQGGEFVFVVSSAVVTDNVNDTKKADTGLDAERKRIEQERKELERIKAEIEERSRLEAERKQLEAEKKKLIEKEVPKYSSISMEFTLDFETGDLRGWTKTGTAFDYQPTLDDNPTARRRGQPSEHQGRYWIGGFEKYQGKPGQKPGNIQGDGPQGTLTSPSFTIPSGSLSFLVGGGNSMNTRIELLVSGRSVLQASGRNTETMDRVTWDLSPYTGQTGRIRIVDDASGGWGHINVDDLKFSSF
jgi:uncharacterized caspase-like protein